ncbi:ricin-type beta-trefoil lectin domain protein [Actinoplanes sp. CA-252034]|uniref:ricin-type beta-trefoil lectin domain protein n=1 Tax=Actinoplanes sp. CA-252034 TaxID=3239906 RepID=UPI003D961476
MRWLRRRGDDGSLPIAVLITLVGVSLGGLLTSMVVNSISDSNLSARRVLALHAAQAGLDVGLAQVRGAVKANAATGEEEGDRSRLPCAPLTGTVGAGNASSYTVSVAYYRTDPQGQAADWLAGNAISCVTVNGPQYVPAYARFTAVGKAVTAGRTLTRTLSGTYVLHTTNANIYGGLIHAYRTSAGVKDHCIDAGSGDPNGGTPVTMQLCSPGAVAQTWAYTDSLQIVLVASQKPSRPLGMCLQAGTTHVTDNLVTVEPCQGTKPSLYRQQWSFNGSAEFVGSELTAGSNTDGSCFYRQFDGTADSRLLLLVNSSACNTSTVNARRWSPDAAVGAGMAASPAGQAVGQLVNYNQFGRCLDVTEKNVGFGHMIAWPCKQNPNPANVEWNQRYGLPAADSSKAGTAGNHATGTITTTTGGVLYCLTSPSSPDLYQYVQAMLCTGTTSQQWTVYGETNRYSTSYQIVDGTGKYCLQPRNPKSEVPDYYQPTTYKISKIYVAACDGSTLQKWNADQNVIAALDLKDVKETK